MAGIMVSASTGVMNSLLGKLATLMGEEFAKLKNLRKEVKFISDELTSMKDALEGLSRLDELDPQTKRWRDIVREMSYDIEDTIDDFMQNIGKSNKATRFVSNTIEHINTLRTRHQIAGRIEEIKALVLETCARRQRYKLDTPTYRPDTPPSSNVAIDPRVATLYETAANLIGVEAPANELVNLLADEHKQLKKVSIVGFGGLGKTTLANVVYGRLKGKFNRCAFVPVSQKPNIPKLIRSLLSQLGSTTPSHGSELNVLLDQLREHLQNNRYLIVIDDIWDEQAWSIIKCAFPENNLGSRVIVTTRIQDVAKACCSHQHDHIFEMKPLSNEDSRRLFLGRIFSSEEACPHQLEDLVVEILKKCGGLPLALISISSMLANEGANQKDRWEHVRDSLGSTTNLTLERMRQILNLSYKDLPSHLRTCFLYLGMYPEDSKIDRSNLEHQWISEGFINKKNGQDVENVARSYFNELVNRSLIQPVDFNNRGSVTACKVHDMMLDLILIKSAEENFFTIVDDPQATTTQDYKIRRLSIRIQLHGTIIFPTNISLSQVRTVLLFGNCWQTPFLPEFKFLRVFYSDAGYADRGFLTGLCKSYHLRYLHFTGTRRCDLPKQISALTHLQTLHVYSPYCRPGSICKPAYLEMGLPDGIGNMKSLRDLTGFDFALNTMDNIKGLGELANLRYLVILCSSIPDDMKRRVDALCSSLGRLGSLEELQLVGSRAEIDGLFPLSPPSTPYRLHTLIVSQKCWFSRVPSWMGELRNLGELQCSVAELLNDGVGILGELPILTVLDITIGNTTKGMIVFSGKAFPALRRVKLQLSSASYLSFQPGAMPKLQRLELTSWARGSVKEVAPTGVEHLLALEVFSAHIYCEESDKTGAEFALMSAVNKHPGNPRFVFNA